MIRKASFGDIQAIFKIVKEVTARLNAEGNNQWNSEYPNKKLLRRDVTNGHMYVKVKDDEVLGMIVLNYEEPEEYRSVKWSAKGRCLVIHRMAVKDSELGKGVGRELLKFSENLARNVAQTACIKADTYSTNKAAKALFESEGYKNVGSVSLREDLGDFHCYERILEGVTPKVRTNKRGRKPKNPV